jgi:hypothetical protein
VTICGQKLKRVSTGVVKVRVLESHSSRGKS